VVELAILLGLFLLNGVFAMSEIAIVSSRKSRLRSLVVQGRPGAARALQLAEEPGRFLSTVQIGITLIGIVAGVFSGATLGGALGQWLAQVGLPAPLASALGYGGIVALVTYFSVVVGELVPKQLALRNAEAISCTVAPGMYFLSVAAAPLVWLLDNSTRLIFRLLGKSEVAEEVVTEEEIKALVAEAAAMGVIERDEKRMIAGVLQLSDSVARNIMTPRVDVEALSLQAAPKTIRSILTQTRHTRLPVSDGDVDNIIGVIVIRECLAGEMPDSEARLREFVRKVPTIPESMGALDVLAMLRQAEQPIALVMDEYGHLEGVVTPSDLLEAIAGVFRSDMDIEAHHHAVQREDGSWLLSGTLSAHAMSDLLDISLPPKRDYQTVAGFLIEIFGRLPQTGESINALGWRFEIVDMDGRRIDKVLASRADTDEAL